MRTLGTNKRPFSSSKNKHFSQNNKRHRSFLINLQKLNKVYPRYDIMSQNFRNNLIVHVQHNPKQQLKPKTPSIQLKAINYKIQQAVYKQNVGKRQLNNKFQYGLQLRKHQLQKMIQCKTTRPQDMLFTYYQQPNYKKLRQKTKTNFYQIMQKRNKF